MAPANRNRTSVSVNASLCLVLRLMSFGSHARIPFEFTPFDTLKILAGGESAPASSRALRRRPATNSLTGTCAELLPTNAQYARAASANSEAVEPPGSATPKMHVRLRTSCAPIHASRGSTTPASPTALITDSHASTLAGGHPRCLPLASPAISKPVRRFTIRLSLSNDS
jgi:hypothetical protein